MHTHSRIKLKTAASVGLLLATSFGCSGSSSDAGNVGSGTGGLPSGGASSTSPTNQGGSVLSGGASSLSAAGQSSALVGGAPSSGGVTGASGGNGGVSFLPTGGTSALGGAMGVGGAVGSGGSRVSTSSTRAGGAPGTGGSSPSGATGKGGASGLGGASNTTSSSRAGGASAAGGTTSAGGTTTGVGGQSSAVCPSPVLASGDTTKTISVGGSSRQYILHVPSAYKGTTATALVLDFHPIGGSATQWRQGSPYPAVIDSEGVISVFPNGQPSPNLGNAWNVGGCCVSKVGGAEVDDVAFAKAIVAEVKKLACIDPKRIYAVGFSMGGGMSNYLACHAADTFAAVGPAAFDLTQQNVTGCTPSRPLTVVEWRGKSDNVVPYAGGHSALVTGMAIDFLGAVGTFQKWASLNGCTGSPSAADSNGCQTYSQCQSGVQVTLCTEASGGHTAAKANVVWPMLKKYTMP